MGTDTGMSTAAGMAKEPMAAKGVPDSPELKTTPTYLWVIALVYGVGVWLAYHIKAELIPFLTFTAEDVGRNLTPILLAALFIERAVEVFISSSRDAEARHLEEEIKNPELDAVKVKALKKTAIDYSALTQRRAFVGSLILGFLVAVIGMRGIAPFVDLKALELFPIQKIFFNAVDIFLTAALLAGGADGIHKIVNVFTNYADAAARKVKES